MTPGDMAKELCELIQGDMAKCDDVGQRIIANRLLEILEPWRPKPKTTPPPAKSKPKSKPAPTTGFDLDDVGDADENVKHALALAEEIEELAGEMPEEGEEFAASASEKAADIAANIEAHGRVTDAQFTALENMLDGLKRWFHD